MKLYRRLIVFLLSAAMLLTLCSCSEKVKPEKINTKEYSREILLRGSGEGIEIVHSNKSTQKLQAGEALKSDDSIRVGSGAELMLDVDGDKQIYAQEGSSLRLEASGTPDEGKTRICLEEGSVLVGLDEPLAEGELFEVQTDAATVSVSEGIVRVSKIIEQDASYTLVEVFEGEANVVIRRTGESATAKAGESVLVNETGKKPCFVLEDEIDQDFWKSGENTGLTVGKDGTGSRTLTIPYSKLPAPVLEQLLEYAKKGRELPVSEETLTNLIETGHDYVETIVKEATCVEDGLVSLECALCGEQSEKVVPATGHTEEEIPEVEATCTQDGSGTGTRCTVCGEILSGCEVIQALGHQVEKQDDIAATCTEDGLIGESHCTVCGAVLQEEATVPALGHRIEELPAVAPACEKDGLTAGSHCSVCGEVFTQQKVVPATGHNCKVISGREPSCTRPGLTDGQRCTICNKLVEAQKTIPMIPHVVEVVPGLPATCTQDGYTDSTVCAVCGTVLTPAEIIPAFGHTESTIPGREATCSKVGLTEGSECSVCGEVLVPQKEIPTLNHTPIATPGKEATCLSIGLTAGERCQVCGKILVRQSVIPKLEHTPKVVHGIYAMCFREGRTDGVVCSVCGYEIEPSEVIPALPHTIGGLARIEPTCTSVGWTEGLACRICSQVITPQKEIPMVPHTEGHTSKAYNPDTPVLDSNGDLLKDANHYPWCFSLTRICSVCGEGYKVDYFAHVPGAAVDEVDWEGNHWAVTRCSDCGKIISRKPACK